MQKQLHDKVGLGQTQYSQRTERGNVKMKSIRVEDITEQMLKELSKKSSMREDKFLDELVSRMYLQMKQTGKKVLQCHQP